MEVSLPENLVTTQRMVTQELMVGREIANQLQSVFDKSDGSGSEKDLVLKIIKSFSEALFILNVKEGVGVSSVISQIQADSGLDSSCLDARKSEEYSQEICMTSTTTTLTKKDRRGCYDKRRTLRTWKIDNPTLINDGQTWRKYGQKVILNAKYHRHYFRCSYKYDQGCKATKQVQRIQVNPPLYRTTYFGQHTCKDVFKHPELILELDCTSPEDTSMFISFDSTKLTNKQQKHFPSIKQEYKEEITLTGMNHNQLSLSDCFVSPDLTSVESPNPMTMYSSTMKPYDQEDLIYGMMEYVDFDLDLFQM